MDRFFKIIKKLSKGKFRELKYTKQFLEKHGPLPSKCDKKEIYDSCLWEKLRQRMRKFLRSSEGGEGLFEVKTEKINPGGSKPTKIL